MAYDATKPLDDGYLAEAPAELRELHRALKEDKIVNAGMLNGYTQGNESGKIPLNNGTLNTNLNADMLDGHDSAYFAAATHTHSAATENANGFMSNTDKAKLNSISSNAEVNQNAFSNVKIGSSTIQADAKSDTLTLVAGTNITLTADATNDTVTISVKDNAYAAASHTHGYIPVSGGYVLTSGTLGRTTDDNRLQISAGPGWPNGAMIVLNGKNYSSDPGMVRLVAHTDTTGAKEFQIRANGEITWGGDITAINFKGTASVASKLGNSNVGNASTPIYLNAGTPTVCSYAMMPMSKSSSGVGNFIIIGGDAGGQVTRFTFPSGGTWLAVLFCGHSNGIPGIRSSQFIFAGGASVGPWDNGYKLFGFAWRIG